MREGFFINKSEIATEITNPNPIRKVHFSARHYYEIADVISRSNTVQDVIENMVELLSEDNVRFREELFMEACRKQ
jgi:hypothetical protein